MPIANLAKPNRGVLEKTALSLLNSLPFNGDKMKLALWVALLAALQSYTGYDFGVGLTPTIVLPASLGAAALFLFGKYLKKRAGLDKWGDAIK